MKVDIDKYTIESTDGNSVTLYERKIVATGEKKGETHYKVLGYYVSIEHALQKILQHNVLSSDVKSFSGILNKIDETHKMIQAYMRGV